MWKRYEQQHNRALKRLRVRVEHVIHRFKIFRILSGRYRNRRRLFGLRLNLIAGLLNYKLAHVQIHAGGLIAKLIAIASAISTDE